MAVGATPAAPPVPPASRKRRRRRRRRRRERVWHNSPAAKPLPVPLYVFFHCIRSTHRGVTDGFHHSLHAKALELLPSPREVGDHARAVEVFAETVCVCGCVYWFNIYITCACACAFACFCALVCATRLKGRKQRKKERKTKNLTVSSLCKLTSPLQAFPMRSSP